VAHTGCPGWWPVGQSKITMSTHFIATHLVFYSAHDTRHSELKQEELGHLGRLLTNHGSKHWIQAFSQTMDPSIFTITMLPVHFMQWWMVLALYRTARFAKQSGLDI
jgi:hypothetical protein